MKKHLNRILSLMLVLILVACCVASPVLAVEPEPLQTWTDDFSSGKGGSYTPYGYWWNMDGKLTVGDTNAGAGVSYYWLNDYVWDDFVMEFDVLEQSAQFGVIFRASNPSSIDCQSQGYGILYDTNWAFFMAENGTFTNFDGMQAAGNAQPVEGCAWATQPGSTTNVHWKIVAKGNRIEVYFNHAETPSMAMDANLYSSGSIGFRTWNNGGQVTAVVDNLSITELAKEPTGGEEGGGTPSGVQTWTDDFGSGKGSSYTPYGYWWNMDGQLTAGDTNAGAGVSYYWLNDYVWDDFVMEFDVLQQSAQFGVIFRASNPSSVDCQSQGYGVLYDTNWAFFMAENGAFTNFDGMQAAGNAKPVDGLAWATQPGSTTNVHWKIVAKGNRIEVYFNHAETPSMAMNANLFSSGAIGFRTWNNGGEVTAVVDNLSITALPTEAEYDLDAFGIKWDAFGGTWTAADGAVNLVGNAETVLPKLMSQSTYQHFTLEMDLIGVKSGGIVFRSGEPALGADAFDGYYVGYDSAYAFFGKDVSGWSTINNGAALATAAAELTYRENMHWKLVVSGNTFTLYVDDMTKPLIQVFDNTFTAAGKIGLRFYAADGAAGGSVKNLTITPIAAEDAEFTTEGTYDLWAKRLVYQNPPAENQNKVILMGASHAEFWSDHAADFAPLETLNFGMGGSWVSHIADKNDMLLVPYAPKAVIVITGGNDLAGGMNAETLTKELSDYLKSLTVDLPDVPIIVLGPLQPRVTDGAPALANKQQINAAIKAFCKDYDDLYYVDNDVLWTASGAANPDLIRPDGIHLNDAGYDKLAEKAVPIVKSILDGTYQPDEGGSGDGGSGEGGSGDGGSGEGGSGEGGSGEGGGTVDPTYFKWEDDFSGAKADSYTPHGYWWNKDGVLTVGDKNALSGVCYYWLKDVVWSDFVMEFDVLDQSAEFGVILRAQNTTADDCKNYGYGVLYDTNWAFFMAENGSFTGFNDSWASQVGSTPFAYEIGATKNVHWKIVAKGDTISVYFNHSETPSMMMRSDLWASGAIGFRTNNPGGAVTAVVDNLVITSLSADTEGGDGGDGGTDEPSGPKWTWRWTDDFSSNKGGSYTPYGYWWNQDGVLTVGDANAQRGVCYYWLKDYVWSDFVMEFDVLDQSAEFGVILRAQRTTADDCQNYGYGVLYDTDWAFFMAENGKFTSFDEKWASKVGNDPYACQIGATKNVHWKIVAHGDTISVYFNYSDTPSMVMRSDLWASGAIGFRTNNPGGAVTAIVDNLTITAIGNPETGDDSNLTFYLAAAAFSILALGAIFLVRRRRCCN